MYRLLSTKPNTVLTLTLVTFSVLFFVATIVGAGERLDVYVVYSTRSKAARNALMQSLSSEITAKKYNVDLLRLADYSGKQKAIAKLSQAKVVVLMDLVSVKAIDISELDTQLLVLCNYSDVTKLPSRVLQIIEYSDSLVDTAGSVITVESVDQLKDVAVLNTSGRILVDTAKVPYFEAVSKIVEMKTEKPPGE